MLLLRHESEFQNGDLHLLQLGLRSDEVGHVALRARKMTLSNTGCRAMLSNTGCKAMLSAALQPAVPHLRHLEVVF